MWIKKVDKNLQAISKPAPKERWPIGWIFEEIVIVQPPMPTFSVPMNVLTPRYKTTPSWSMESLILSVCLV